MTPRGNVRAICRAVFAGLAPTLAGAGCAADRPRLVAMVHPEGAEGSERTLTFTCETDGAPACVRLRTLDPDAFAPVPDAAVSDQTVSPSTRGVGSSRSAH